jgi:hypothetical protein
MLHFLKNIGLHENNSTARAHRKGFDIGTTKHVTDMDPAKITTALEDSAKSKVPK